MHAKRCRVSRAEAKAAFATQVERAAALESEAARLDEGYRELEVRIRASQASVAELERQSDALRALVDETILLLDGDGVRLETLRADVRGAEEAVTELRDEADRFEAAIREARKRLEGAHQEVAELEVSRATAQSSLAHLANRAWKHCR